MFGLCPIPLHGASRRILSNDSGKNGGPSVKSSNVKCGHFFLCDFTIDKDKLLLYLQNIYAIDSVSQLERSLSNACGRFHLPENQKVLVL